MTAVPISFQQYPFQIVGAGVATIIFDTVEGDQRWIGTVANLGGATTAQWIVYTGVSNDSRRAIGSMVGKSPAGPFIIDSGLRLIVEGGLVATDLEALTIFQGFSQDIADPIPFVWPMPGPAR